MKNTFFGDGHTNEDSLENTLLENRERQYQKLEEKRVRALEEQDALKYSRICDQMGLSKECLEDPYLYERGLAEEEHRIRSIEQFKKNLRYKKIPLDKNYSLENVVEVALPRFPECDRREKIRKKEVTERLGKLKKLGYPLEAYSKMDSKETWKYFMKIRAQIYAEAERDCPNLLNEIKKDNEDQKKNTGIIR